MQYFAESVNPKYEGNFPAVSLKRNILGLGGSDYEEFVNDEINENDIVDMGFACPTSASGPYYLQTNAKSLYGKGIDGIKYEEQDDDGDEDGDII